jgi:uncharacterized protein (TIGR02453 family)
MGSFAKRSKVESIGSATPCNSLQINSLHAQLKSKRISPLTDNTIFYPPFEGFPAEGIRFLKSLKKHNNRPWFEKHKSEFETNVRLPMQSLIVSLQPHFARFAPEFEVHPKRSIFRIYRDVRFSKDKKPYKTHVAMHAVLRGKPKGVGGSGYYLHIEPGEVFQGAGIYMPDADQLRKIRCAISEQPDELLSLVQDKNFKKRFGTMEGERLQRIPAGFEKNNPMAEWLKLKQFFVGVSLPESKCHSERFVDDVAAVFEEATPLVKFLNRALGL